MLYFYDYDPRPIAFFELKEIQQDVRGGCFPFLFANREVKKREEKLYQEDKVSYAMLYGTFGVCFSPSGSGTTPTV